MLILFVAQIQYIPFGKLGPGGAPNQHSPPNFTPPPPNRPPPTPVIDPTYAEIPSYGEYSSRLCLTYYIYKLFLASSYNILFFKFPDIGSAH